MCCAEGVEPWDADSFVLFACHKRKVSQINQESFGFPPEYELDLGCRENHRMENHTRTDPYRVGRPELKLLLAGAVVEVANVGCCVTHHEFDVIGSDVLDNTGFRGVDGEWGCVIPLHEPE